MRFLETVLKGAFVIEPDPYQDERGLFARTFCEREFAGQGLAAKFVQCSTSLTRLSGTVRGLHYQLPPVAEVKLVRCTAGAIFDVIVDLRPESPTFGRHLAMELTAANRKSLYVPALFAHGFQTLVNDAEVFYQISEFYAPENSAGLRYDDPALDISWPLAVSVVSDKDKGWPLLKVASKICSAAP
jgi:dTDP-4-dehydrorhamnose 3,5-epimerase